MRATAAAVLAGLGAASPVWAQCQGCEPAVTYTLNGALVIQVGGSWTNAPFIGAFGNSVTMTGPDQGALFRITMTMALPAGAATTANGGTLGGPVTWDPTIQFGSSGQGTNAGFWSGDLNLNSTGAAPGGAWSDGTGFNLSVRTRLLVATAGNTGTPTATGNGRTDIQPAQFEPDADTLNHGTSYTVFQGMWFPAQFDVRTVNFTMGIGSLGLLSMIAAADSNYDHGYTLPVALRQMTNFGNGIAVGVIPAPAGLGLLVAGCLAVARRRRAGLSSGGG